MKKIVNKIERLPERCLLKVLRILKQREASGGGDFWSRYFLEKIMDPNFDTSKYKNIYNPYFSQWGFKLSVVEKEYYRQINGIESDLYIPSTLYYNYIQPFLNQNILRIGFVDKNMFDPTINFDYVGETHGIKFPQTIVYNICGCMMDGITRDSITKEQAAKLLIEYGKDFIIKPTRESTWGKGVRKVCKEDLTPEFIDKLLDEYKMDYICQSLIKQHPELAKYNCSSLNTIRVATYRNFDGSLRCLYGFLRFGKKGSVVDNVSAGGSMFGVDDEGNPTNRRLIKFASMNEEYLDPSLDGKIPYFPKIKEACLYLHSRIPQFALIGWDMTIDENMSPTMIEYNISPSIEIPQISHGPIWTRDELDEIMKRVSKYRLDFRFSTKVIWPDKKNYFQELFF